MAAPVKLNYKIYQGSTFREIYRWETSTKIYVPITGISKTAPVVVTAPNHGMPTGWRAKIGGVLGMKEINTGEQYITATDAAQNTVTFNHVNAVNYGTYTSGGILEYNQPVDLAGYAGRMQIRQKVDSPDVILSLTTENGGIEIDNTFKTITIQMTAQQTQSFTFQLAVYSLELVKGSEVFPFSNGTLTLVKEVTR